MEFTINNIDIEFDVEKDKYEEDYYPVNITLDGRPIELNQNEWNKLYDHVQTLQLTPDKYDWDLQY